MKKHDNHGGFKMNKITILIIAVLLVIGGSLYYSGKHTLDLVYVEEELDLKTFSSYEEFKDFVKESQSSGYWGGFGRADMLMATAEMAESQSATKADGAQASEYSTTNVQVEGVDEADIVKNDGKYIYTVTGNKVVIVDAYPAEKAKVLSEIKFERNPNEIFINEDRLLVFGTKQAVLKETDKITGNMMIMPPYPRYDNLVLVSIYDVSDRENPELVDEITMKGYYMDSRMIGDYVYLIANENIYYYENKPIPMPMLTRSGVEKTVEVTDIMFCPIPYPSYRYTNIIAINTQDENEELNHKVVLTGNSQELYMSLDNLYLTGMKYMSWIDQKVMLLEKAILPSVPKSVSDKIDKIDTSDLIDYKKWSEIEDVVSDYSESLTTEEESRFNEKMQEKLREVEKEIAKETEKTVIHRVAVDKGSIEYKAEGTVPGRVLNQFSMDEYDNHFRITTTAGRVSRTGSTSTNNVYVLDMDLNIVGEVEDLAPGESIYSARFIGKRAYLVTFKKVDPLFVIDMANPTNPKVLGKLKIPGYSDYLHPYDENHLIGLGKGAVAAEQGDFAWYQGVKLSLFDVSDVSKPKELAKYEIGDRGTNSYALHDHKAFLFDKDKNLLVIPILLAEIDEEKYPSGIEPFQQGDYTFQGAYVFNVDLDGFDLKGRVTHVEDDDAFLKSGYYYYNDAESVKRSLYMDDVLYTLSGKLIKMNNLDSLEEINSVKLPYEVDQREWDDVEIMAV